MRCKIFTLLLDSVVVFSVFILPTRVWGSSDVEKHLRDQYKGKTLLLRNFYAGHKLHYDESGKLSPDAPSGDWTVDGVIHVDDVKLANHRLTIQAKRNYMGWGAENGLSDVPAPAGKLGKEYEESRKLSIEADVGPRKATVDDADAVFARIFLTPQELFVDLVPDYWKPCVLSAISRPEARKYDSCQFSPEFLAIPAVSKPPREKPGKTTDRSATRDVFRPLQNGVTLPRTTYSPNPEFDPEARLAKHQGTVTLMVVVDKSGSTRDIRITSPLGCGLDRQAVEVVATWKFDPGSKGGKPVDVEIAVEVDFHLN